MRRDKEDQITVLAKLYDDAKLAHMRAVLEMYTELCDDAENGDEYARGLVVAHWLESGGG
jgi:hypothetical protein